MYSEFDSSLGNWVQLPKVILLVTFNNHQKNGTMSMYDELEGT